MKTSNSNIRSHGVHKPAACISCKHEREARSIDPETKLCRMCSLKVKQGKPLVNQAGSSGQSISNGNGDEEGNDNDDHYQELDADDSASQIGEKRTRKEAGLKVDEDDLEEYHKSSTATEDVVIMVNTCTSKGTQQQ